MKNLLLLSLSLTILCSCSKNDSPTVPPVTKDSSCLVVSMIFDFTGYSYPHTKYSFSYDANGRLTQVEYNDSAIISTYKYNGSQIFIDNPPYIVDTTQVNNYGFITKWTNISNDPVVTDTSISTFNYTNDTVLTSAHRESLTIEPDDVFYTFTNGDLTKTSFSDYGDLTCTYYDDKLLIGAEFNDLNYLMQYGARIYKNKHLLKTDGSAVFTNNYTYTFDAAGKVLTETIVNANGSFTYTFSYACHL